MDRRVSEGKDENLEMVKKPSTTAKNPPIGEKPTGKKRKKKNTVEKANSLEDNIWEDGWKDWNTQ